MAQSDRRGSLRDRLLLGVRFLEASVRPDGGVSAVADGDVSGIWTTAEALEVLCIAPFLPHERLSMATQMWGFLEHTQIYEQGGHEGAWPMVKGGRRGSPIATGHAVAALTAAQDYFREFLPNSLRVAIEGGVAWLLDKQSKDGGWSIEPNGDSPTADAFMISTVHAVMGLSAAGYTVDTSKELQSAAQWILRAQTVSGGFATAPGFEADPCNTARAIRALLQIRALPEDHPSIRRAVKYLTRSKPAGSVWAITVESFVVEGGSGPLTLTRNTPADALEALMLADPDCREVHELVEWFMTSQEANGSWKLHRAPDERRKRVETWSTSGAIRSLIRYEHRLAGRQTPRLALAVRDILVIALSAGLAIETFFLLGTTQPLTDLWGRLPVWLQAVWVGTALVSTVIMASFGASAVALRRFRREQ